MNDPNDTHELEEDASFWHDDSMWDLYDHPTSFDDDTAATPSPNDNNKNNHHDDPSDHNDESQTVTTRQTTIWINDTLSIRLHAPLSILEDGCMGYTGGIVWDCAVSFARYLTTTPSPPPQLTNQDEIANMGGNGTITHPHSIITSFSSSGNPVNNDGRGEWWCHDHILELGSGLGLLGLAVYQHLTTAASLSQHDTNTPCRKVTLTDCVPQIIHALHLSALDHLQTTTTTTKIDPTNFLWKDVISLSVADLDWSNPNHHIHQVIVPYESLLVLASEVIYEPVHAVMLSNCIQAILYKSGTKQGVTTIMIANRGDRPGWIEFCTNMKDMASSIIGKEEGIPCEEENICHDTDVYFNVQELHSDEDDGGNSVSGFELLTIKFISKP